MLKERIYMCGLLWKKIFSCICFAGIVLFVSGCETMIATSTGKVSMRGVSHMVRAGAAGEPISLEDLNDIPPTGLSGQYVSGQYGGAGVQDLNQADAWLQQNLW